MKLRKFLCLAGIMLFTQPVLAKSSFGGIWNGEGSHSFGEQQVYCMDVNFDIYEDFEHLSLNQATWYCDGQIRDFGNLVFEKQGSTLLINDQIIGQYDGTYLDTQYFQSPFGRLMIEISLQPNGRLRVLIDAPDIGGAYRSSLNSHLN